MLVKAVLGFLLLVVSFPPDALDLAFGKHHSRIQQFPSLFLSPDVICYQILTPPRSLQTVILHMVHGNIHGYCK